MASPGGRGRHALLAVAAVAVVAASVAGLRALLAPAPSPAQPLVTQPGGQALRSTPWPAGVQDVRPDAAPGGSSAPAREAGAAAAPPTATVTREVAMAAARGDGAAAARLAEAVQEGDPRAYAFSALYCVHGSGCDPAPGDRMVALAASQVRAGLAIRSGDPEAIYHAALAIAQPALGRSAMRGAAWMLVACRRGYDCLEPAELDRSWPCAANDDACRSATTVEDRLQAILGAGSFARAYTLADEFGAMLDDGDVTEAAVAYGAP
ncbi:MAG: hypothetical protein MUC71_00095 [Steroidobacteraceae bacterium]|jgi:hypothetical protein|nr:hypothetical protein [Steroidobacteraceae bacterium]